MDIAGASPERFFPVIPQPQTGLEARRRTMRDILAGPTDDLVTAATPSAHVSQHSLGRSVLLHLLPGLLALGVYAALTPIVLRWGFPPLFASVLTIPLVLLPWMIGWLAFEARRATGRYQPLAVVTYRTKLTPRRMITWSAALIAWGAIVFGIAEAIGASEPLRSLFAALPEWFLNPADFDQIVGMQTLQLAIFLLSMVLIIGIAAPAVEELYFRGYLMPAIGRFGVWTPVLGVALFTLYHFESLWESPARFIVVLPMAYAVWSLRSIRLGIVVHVALNALSAILLAVAVIAAR